MSNQNKTEFIIGGILLALLLVLAPTSIFAAKDGGSSSDSSSSSSGSSGSSSSGDSKSSDSKSSDSKSSDSSSSSKSSKGKGDNDGGVTGNKIDVAKNPNDGSANSLDLGAKHGGIDDSLQDNADDVLGDVMRDGTRIKDGQVVGHEPVTCRVNSQQAGCGPGSDPSKLPGDGSVMCLDSTNKCPRPPFMGPPKHDNNNNNHNQDIIIKVVNKHTNKDVTIVRNNIAIAIAGTPFPLTDFHFFADGSFLPICGTVEDKLIGGNCWDNMKQVIVKA